ncbi:LapA family protein [Syntrophomonas palmitatica]|uniref:LapA family protein n=1 Tax=Syntrophomonas palmitatica TaxID=402877 RepID=UPI0006CFE53E|nr:LapA family protein [Syntrophomonas palmitatica]
MQAYLIIALLFFLGIAAFVFQNPTLVEVKFLNWTSPEVSLAVVALIAACAGALVIFMVDSFRYFKLAKQVKDYKTDNKKLQKELKILQSEKEKRNSRENKKSSQSSESVVNPEPAANSNGNDSSDA